MRVLHIASCYGTDVTKGGVARAAELLSRVQARVGAEVTLYTTGHGRQESRLVDDRMSGRQVQIHIFPEGPWFCRVFPASFFRACLDRAREFDIIHLHGIWSFPGTWGSRAARSTRVPYVVSPQGMLNEWAVRHRAYKKIPYWYAVERHTVAGAALIHFATEEEQRQARPWVVGKKSKVIPIGLDLDEFTELPQRGEFRDREGISRGVPMMAFLGRIHPIKGLEVLLRALVRIKAEIPEVVLAVAGPDSDGYGGRLRGLAEDLGIEGQVRWLGTIEEQAKPGFLLDADLFVLPSFSENFGLAAVEAMAVGCPVIIGSGVNIAPQVEANGGGWVVPTEPDLLAEMIVKTLRDPEARLTAGQNGQRLVKECYDGEVAAREMLKAYEECLR